MQFAVHRCDTKTIRLRSLKCVRDEFHEHIKATKKCETETRSPPSWINQEILIITEASRAETRVPDYHNTNKLNVSTRISTLSVHRSAVKKWKAEARDHTSRLIGVLQSLSTTLRSSSVFSFAFYSRV
jgi:hypothetical protein